ncbi:GWxTD domain-containing protein [bacterium]|nr:GWxTD domain-containing protein [bacterium]
MGKNIRCMKIVFYRFSFLLAFLVAHFVFAQLPEMQPLVEEGIPDYYFDVVTFQAEDPGKCLLKLYTKVCYDELQFVQTGDQYRAEYEVSIVAFNQQGNQENGKMLKRDVMVDRFEKTNSMTDFDLTEIDFTISPGEYELLIDLMDLDTKKTSHQKMNITIPDYEGSSFNVSDILFTDTVIVDLSGEFIFKPNVLRNFGSDQESLYLYYEIYNRLPVDSVQIVYEVQDNKEKVIREEIHYKVLEGIETDDIIEIPRKDLEGGQYRLVLKIGEDEYVIKREKDFTVRWMGLPAIISDLNVAIEQLRYIAESDEFKKMQRAEEEDRQRLFKKFWDSKDSTPGTNNNENMEEYYRRVQFANEAFGSQNNGWETDRGMVFITLGAPDEVERHPFDIDSYPYDIWYYYRWSVYFIFQSISGFGELRLINTDDFWDLTNRIR